ncbi:hypothetical protein B0E46_14555 [Rhodanobacter sp. B04]|uniref:EVE domain-containing protein n=1 Tax=Rhodanobacter sp. B04 TaxID=1945860 RepID=UPI00098423D5|nr:EVE domain-containing protein [Rhodanobacter sp. B04]OOG61767.1 hypothetical protein B0E46_14555 [Rhodanobacter sp. B04]
MVHSSNAIETRFWIICAPRDHVMQSVKGGFCQLTHGRTKVLQRMSPGDWIACYSDHASSESNLPCQCFTAIGKVAEREVYHRALDEQRCPFRRDVHYSPVNEVDIRLLLSKLSFIKNKTYWALPFRRGYLEVSESDFRDIAERMLEEAFSP